ncbi:IS66 family transposase [Aliidongia sp.]|uniref:IS66 family transposase n=1 Tax=Aliidongia sp. TaxID=1914230 RepID=UPI002DDD1F82|nr:transposase [Aliidongia sp.]
MEASLRDTSLSAEVRAADHAARVARKAEHLKYFDVLGMDDIVAIVAWGRSASLLLASYLDSHTNVLMLQREASERIIQFFEETRNLSLWERLLAYPAYTDAHGHPFFHGEFAISELDYRAAIDSLIEKYGDRPVDVLASHRAFFQFVYAAYNVARDYRPAIPRPSLVYFQHHRSDKLAAYLSRDFPKVRFLHTIRHPIACFRSSVERSQYMGLADGRLPQLNYLSAVLSIAVNLTNLDHPHDHADARTSAVRFEDLQTHPEETMRNVAAWLGLPWRASLATSTFNGIPYVVERTGGDWVGSQPAQINNPSRGVSRWDQAVLFSLFHENFIAWGYPSPAHFRFGCLRWSIVFMLAFIPMSLEWIVARNILRVQIKPALRLGDFRFAVRAARRPLACHVALVKHVAGVLWRRRRGQAGNRTAGKRGNPALFTILAPSDAAACTPSIVPIAVASARDLGDVDSSVAALLTKYRAGDIPNLCRDEIVRGKLPAGHGTAAVHMTEALTLLDPLVRRIRAHVAASDMLHVADLPVAVHTTGQPKQGRVWTYIRDLRSVDMASAPAVSVFYSADRSTEIQLGHLPGFTGFLQTSSTLELKSDAGASRPIINVASWAHCRNKFSEMPTPCHFPMIKEALDRLDDIFLIDADARYSSLAERATQRAAQRVLVQRLFTWSEGACGQIDPKSGLAAAFRYMLDRRASLSRIFDHDGTDFENVAIMRIVAGLSWDRAIWWGPDSREDGDHAAQAYTVIESAKLNDLDVQAYLREILLQLKRPQAVVELEPLLPWNYGRSR